MVDTGFKFNACSQTHYCMVGKENLPSSFRNMKISLIHYLNKENYQKSAPVMKSCGPNFASIVSTLEKLNTPETEALQETILRLNFVLDYLFMSDVMPHLTSCSKMVQQSFTMDLPRDHRLDLGNT